MYVGTVSRVCVNKTIRNKCNPFFLIVDRGNMSTPSTLRYRTPRPNAINCFIYTPLPRFTLPVRNHLLSTKQGLASETRKRLTTATTKNGRTRRREARLTLYAHRTTMPLGGEDIHMQTLPIKFDTCMTHARAQTHIHAHFINLKSLEACVQRNALKKKGRDL